VRGHRTRFENRVNARRKTSYEGKPKNATRKNRGKTRARPAPSAGAGRRFSRPGRDVARRCSPGMPSVPRRSAASGPTENAAARPARCADARGRSPGAPLGAPSARADARPRRCRDGMRRAAELTADRRDASGRSRQEGASARFRAVDRGSIARSSDAREPRPSPNSFRGSFSRRTLGGLIPPKCMADRAVSFRRGSETGHDRRVVRFARLGSHKRTWSVPTSSTRRARRCDARAEVPGSRGTARRRLGQISSATFSIARSRSFQSRRFSFQCRFSREWPSV
jgi:hypothetical protein